MVGKVFTSHDFDLNKGRGKEVTAMTYVESYNDEDETYNCIALVKQHQKIYFDYGREAWTYQMLNSEHKAESDEKTLIEYLFTFLR